MFNFNRIFILEHIINKTWDTINNISFSNHLTIQLRDNVVVFLDATINNGGNIKDMLNKRI